METITDQRALDESEVETLIALAQRAMLVKIQRPCDPTNADHWADEFRVAGNTAIKEVLVIKQNPGRYGTQQINPRTVRNIPPTKGE